MDEVGAFVAVAVVVIVAPGPDFALLLRNAIAGGRAAGMATALGVSTGQIVWAAATSSGLAALLVASEPAFLLVKYAGAAYLIWLGLRTLGSVRRPNEASPSVGGNAGTVRLRDGFRQGLVSNLGNPKMVAFFTSLFPQFVDRGDGALVALLALGLAFSALTFAWLALVAAVTERVRGALSRGVAWRSVERVTGVLLIGLGARVAAEGPP